jgi:hypothetical protein
LIRAVKRIHRRLPAPPISRPRHQPRRQRDHHVKHHRQEQCLPWHRDVRDAQKERHDRREGEDHYDVVQRHLHERVVRIAPGQLRPDEDHRSAGRRAQKDQPCDVLTRVGRVDQVGKEVFEEQHAQRGHREWLDQPVDDHRDHQALGLAPDAAEAAQVHADHHRVDHRPDQDRHDQVDGGVFDRGERREKTGKDLAQRQPREDRGQHPEAQETLESTHVAVPVRLCPFLGA